MLVKRKLADPKMNRKSHAERGGKSDKAQKRLKDSKIIGLVLNAPDASRSERRPLWTQGVQVVNSCWGPNPEGELLELAEELTEDFCDAQREARTFLGRARYSGKFLTARLMEPPLVVSIRFTPEGTTHLCGREIMTALQASGYTWFREGGCIYQSLDMFRAADPETGYFDSTVLGQHIEGPSLLAMAGVSSKRMMVG